MNRRLLKAPDILVVPQRTADGLLLINQRTGEVCRLSGQTKVSWLGWLGEFVSRESLTDVGRSLLERGFIREASGTDELCAPNIYDAVRPAASGSFVKCYCESSDLSILFNSSPMSRNNPLLALGP
jgi:hypothetical protein